MSATYATLTGGGTPHQRRQPTFRTGLTESPDGVETTDLRHYWTTRDGGDRWLTVIGPDLGAVEEEYHRLWAEELGTSHP
ncbi:hypothetical protein [Streptomyces sp. NPDC020983]|uniref:hypothetical protein n=1 Tax=Streptomyces sp. NPDC020983 TaxID=3365106 RepID=UPI0037B340D1